MSKSTLPNTCFAPMDSGSNPLPPGYQYWAFLSYSHGDSMWADWLHESLETYRLPDTVAGGSGAGGVIIPERIYPVFQDGKELPTKADLGSALEEALAASYFLVVLCSPRSAKSLWVNQEILRFKQMGRESRIMPIILSGEPNASEPGKEQFDPATECFPEALRYKIGPEGLLDKTRRTEPIAADIRLDNGDPPSLETLEHAPILDREKLRVIAGIAGVGFDQLIQRDRQRELLRVLQEKAAREEEAKRLVRQAEETVETLHKDAALHGQDFVFAQLGAAEDSYVQAAQKNPELENVGERLREIRTLLVETSIESGDLNMATLFLARLRQTPGAGTESHALKERLDVSLAASDPRLHSGLKKAESIGFGASLAGLVWPWICAWVFQQFFSDSETGNPSGIARPVLFFMHIPLAIALLTLRMLGRARVGEEAGHRRAVLGSYFASVCGFVTFNVPIFTGFAVIIHLLQSEKILKLSWRLSAAKKTRNPHPKSP